LASGLLRKLTQHHERQEKFVDGALHVTYILGARRFQPHHLNSAHFLQRPGLLKLKRWNQDRKMMPLPNHLLRQVTQLHRCRGTHGRIGIRD